MLTKLWITTKENPRQMRQSRILRSECTFCDADLEGCHICIIGPYIKCFIYVKCFYISYLSVLWIAFSKDSHFKSSNRFLIKHFSTWTSMISLDPNYNFCRVQNFNLWCQFSYIILFDGMKRKLVAFRIKLPKSLAP